MPTLVQGGPESADNFEYAWSSGTLEVYLLSDVGRKRSRNEDACVVCVPEEAAEQRRWGLLLAVADGMGGVSGGALASRTALEALCGAYFEEEVASAPERLRRGVSAANSRIFALAEATPELKGMGTTVSAVAVVGEYAYIAQVGDSRVYHVGPQGRLAQLTEDHSLVAEQVRNGYLSEQEAQNHSLKNLITRAVGTREATKPDLFCLRLREGDRLLACSDGLSNVVSEGRIAEALGHETLQGAGRRLVGQALEGGAPDNVTAAALRVLGPLPRGRRAEGALDVTPYAPGIVGRLRKLFA